MADEKRDSMSFLMTPNRKARKARAKKLAKTNQAETDPF
jgi:hypothetical protein